MTVCYWLMKSEPQTFSIENLENSPKQTTLWEGVRNYQARNTLRDDMKIDDLAFFYHSSCPVPAIVGIVKVTREAYPDPTAFDPKSPYYDAKSTPQQPRWFCVNVTLVEKLKHPLTLTRLREEPSLNDFTLLKKGNRLSVFSVTSKQWHFIQKLIQKDAL